MEDVVSFRLADVYDIPVRDGYYDVVLAGMALHHFSPLEEILERINRFLRPDSYFVAQEFVGPSRFQWTDRQLQAANVLLQLLPAKYRVRQNSNELKEAVFSPSVLRMVLSDPSEAVESSRILPLAARCLRVLEVRELGGSLLHPLLAGIAHNFVRGDEDSARFLGLCIEAEDLLMKAAEIGSDFALIVCGKRTNHSVRTTAC